jgi:hypothetical protein
VRFEVGDLQTSFNTQIPMTNRQETTMFRPRNFSALLLAAAVALTFGACRASADSIVYDLTTVNISGFTGPFVQVTVNRTDSTHATITFDSLTNGGFTYLMHTNGAAAVNVNATSWTVGSIAASFLGSPLTAPTDGGSGNEDGFGKFNQTISMSDGNPAQGTAASEISFILTNTSGTWSSAANVLTPNGSGQVAAAQIGAWNGVTGNGFTNTGFAGDAATVPEPSTLAIAGLGALGFVGFGLRRRLKK